MGRNILIFIAILIVLGVVLTRYFAASREASARASHPPQGQFVDVNGSQVHVIVQGSGLDLVLIHGASGNTNDFTFDLVDRLADRYRVVVFDRPGLGYTQRLDSSYDGAFNTKAETPIEQASLLKAAADQLGVRKPIVLGHSYGGAVALGWAIQHPNNISALVLLGSVSNPWPTDLGALYRGGRRISDH